MSAPVFLVEPSGAAGPGDVVRLGGAEGRHASAVLRLGAGERLDLVDGVGVRLSCTVVTADRDGLEVRVESRVEEPAPQPRLVVVQALAKGDRGELAVEVLTEVGVDVVVPWAAVRCVVQWRGDRGVRALERWRSTAREAGKQARRARHPEVRDLASTADVARLIGGAACAVVLHESATDPLPAVEVPAAGDVVVVVGPEGGVTEDELEVLVGAGASVRRLGPSVLRTSTAGAVAAGVLLSRTPRWS